jgi:TRAP-type C4-dicarboxylate transport system permease small subunit
MRSIQRVTSAISLVGAYVAGAILCMMTLHILLEIVLRTFFDASTFIMDEMVGYGVAAITFIGLGHALDFGALIRVNLLLTRLGESGPARRIVEVSCILLTQFVVGVAIWYFAKTVIRNYERGYLSQTISEIPTWIPQAWVLAGLVIFSLQLVAYLLRVLAGQPLARTDPEMDFD